MSQQKLHTVHYIDSWYQIWYSSMMNIDIVWRTLNILNMIYYFLESLILMFKCTKENEKTDLKLVSTIIFQLEYNKVKLATIVKGNPKAPFSIATTPLCRGGRYSFPGLLYFTLDPYLIMLSVKQGGIKYHFLSLWYDSTWDWTQVSRAIGEHSNP